MDKTHKAKCFLDAFPFNKSFQIYELVYNCFLESSDWTMTKSQVILEQGLVQSFWNKQTKHDFLGVEQPPDAMQEEEMSSLEVDFVIHIPKKYHSSPKIHQK